MYISRSSGDSCYLLGTQSLFRVKICICRGRLAIPGICQVLSLSYIGESMYMSKSIGDYCHLSDNDVVVQVKLFACSGRLIINTFRLKIINYIVLVNNIHNCT